VRPSIIMALWRHSTRTGQIIAAQPPTMMPAPIGPLIACAIQGRISVIERSPFQKTLAKARHLPATARLECPALRAMLV